MSNLRARLGLKDGGSLRERLGLKDGGPVHMQDGGDPAARFMGKTKPQGIMQAKGFGEGRENIEKALQAIKESAPVSAASQLASGYMSGAGGTDLEKIGQAASMLPMIGLPATIGKVAKGSKLVRDPGFKMAPGSVENLAGKSYAQWAAEQQYKHDLEDALAKISDVPGKTMSIQDIPIGSRLISIIGDRTQADKILRSVNETPLVNEVYLFGGPKFGKGKLAQGKEEFWASQDKAAQGVQNRVDAAAERAKGKPVIGVYTAMGAKDSDMYAKHFAEALIEQYPYMSMTNKQIDGFNKQFRKQYPQFAGIDNAKFVDQIMSNSEMRKAFVTEHLKKKNIKDFGIPDGLATRHAITVPELRDVPSGLAGFSMGELKPGEVLQKGSYLEHPTYNTVIPGRYMGGLEIMQDYRDLFPDATKRMLQTLKNNPKFQGPGGKNPESQLFGTFGFQGAEQEVTQKLIDELAAREEMIKKIGILPYKKGGKVKFTDNPDVKAMVVKMAKELPKAVNKGKKYA